MAYQSWGRVLSGAERVVRLPAEGPGVLPPGPILPFGNGRSYGDVCLNSSGTLLHTRAMSRILAFDPAMGRIRCQAGALLSEVLDVVVPAGWFLPVTPGTKFVTVGGAIANDVHGKNHHRRGTFGRHVLELELYRSDGASVVCSPGVRPEWFRATVGGLGLTGLILQAEIQLIRMPGRRLDVESLRFGGLAEYFALATESDRRFEYTVAWVDTTSRRALGRGWFLAGNHAEGPTGPGRPRGPRLRVPFELPVSLVTPATIRVFNTLYYRRPVPRRAAVDYDPYFYPLDGVLDWNRLYGPRGFYQFQCVVPPSVGEPAIREILMECLRAGQGSALTVLKTFGDLPSPGLLSFPRPGPTLALDLPNRGEDTRALLGRLEAIVAEAGGAIYPSKDACMSADLFQRAFPAWRTLETFRDPAFMSDFWRRVTGPVRPPE